MALIQSSAVTKTLGGASNAPSLSGVAAGNLLVLTVTWAQQTNANPPTVAGWSIAENPTGVAFAGGIAWVGTAIFYLENAPAGRAEPIIVPAASSTSCVLTAQVSEFATGLTSGALDKHTNATGTASTSGGTGTTATTTNAGELVIAVLGPADAAGGPHANLGISTPASSGYTSLGVNQVTSDNTIGYEASYKYVTSTGTQTASWTWTDSSSFCNTIATFALAPKVATVSDVTINDGATGVFTASATTSNGSLSYQWQDDSGGSFANVSTGSGGTTASFTTAALSYSAQGRQHRCIVTDSDGSTTSNAAVLRVAFKLSGTGPRSVPILGEGTFASGEFGDFEQGTASASGPTGTLARTNANDTSSASGTTTVVGSASRTNANDTSSASGTTTVQGTLARTNANDSVSASGSVGSAVSGTLARTNANDTSSAAGTTTVVGSASRTNANDTSAASGSTTVVGASSSTNANDSISASGAAGSVTGTIATTNANDSLVAVGNTPSSAPTVAGAPGGASRYIAYINGKRYAGSYWQIKAMVEELAEDQAEKEVAKAKQAKRVRIVVEQGKEAKRQIESIVADQPIKVQQEIRSIYNEAYARAKLKLEEELDEEEAILMLL